MEKGVATLIKHSADSVDHVVLCLTRGGTSARFLPAGAEVIELGKRPGNSPRFLLRLVRVLRGLRPCVVHTRNWPGLDGLIAARLAGIRHVVHGEHGLGSDDPTGLDPKRLLVRRALRCWPREYTCVSRSLERWLCDVVRVPRPVTRILNGVDTAVYRPGSGVLARQGLGISEGAFVVGIVARLDAIKDHPTLFTAYTRVRATVPHARLLVAGDGPERGRLEASAPEGVRFLGDLGNVANLLRAFDVFVLPSANEGISNSILEAMASGVAVVASRVGGNSELVEDGVTGTLFPAGDAEALASAVLAYAASKYMRVDHGSRGRRRAEEQFGMDAMVRGYLKVWERVGC
jgi:sugar transferase (PEP-CTERM/EpsH1 system associated)